MVGIAARLSQPHKKTTLMAANLLSPGFCRNFGSGCEPECLHFIGVLSGSGVCGGSRGGGRVTATSHSLKLSVCKFIRQWNVWGNYLAMKDLAVRAIVSMSCSRVTHTYRPKRAPRKL